MITSLLVAEVVLLLLVVVDRWLDIAPFNDVAAQRARGLSVRARDTFVECAPILVAIVCTAALLLGEAPSWMGLAPVAALSFALASAVRMVWLPWFAGAPAPVRASALRRVTTTSARALRPQPNNDDMRNEPVAVTATATQESDVHAFLEPRRPGAVVPSTFACLTHAHAVACVLMAVIALLAP